MRSILMSFFGLLFFGLLSSALAADPTDPTVPSKKVAPSKGFKHESTAVPGSMPNHNISLEIKDEAGRDTVKRLMEQAGMKYDMPKNLPSRNISMKMENKPWDEVFNAVIAQAGYDYSVSGDGVLKIKAATVKKGH